MNANEYNLVLDSLSTTGIYVIREDNHQILYFNQTVKNILPQAKLGMVCHELWQGSCACCPLIDMGDKKTNHSFNANGPGNKAMDLTATRILWEDSIPAFVVTFTPHAETYNSTYAKIVKGNITKDTCEAVVMNEAERKMLPADGFTLTQALESFMRGGFLYKADIARFKAFSDLANMGAQLKSGKKCLVCNYRRVVDGQLRWNTMEVLPDEDYTDDDQSIMIYVKDVQDLYSEGLSHEMLSVKNAAVLKVLGEENFGVYLVDIETGEMSCIKAAPEDEGFLMQSGRAWQEVAAWLTENRYVGDSRGKFDESFGFEALARLWAAGTKKQEQLLQRRVNGKAHYVDASAYCYQAEDGGKYAVLSFKDVDESIRREVGYTQQERRMAAAIRAGYDQIIFVNLNTGSSEYVDFANGSDAVTEPYAACFTHALDEKVYKSDKEAFAAVFSPESLQKKAEDVQGSREEVFCYRMGQKPPFVWLEQHIFYIRQEDGVEIGIFGRNISQEKLREEQAERSAKEKAYIVNSLSSMFFSTGYIDFAQGTLDRLVQRSAVVRVLDGKRGYMDCIGTYAEKFVNPEDKEGYLEALGIDAIRQRLSTAHPVVAYEFREIAPQGEDEHWIRASVVLAETQNDKPTAALYVAQDITGSKHKEIEDRRLLQDALETANLANTAKSEFLSRMSHDIRTPMNAILGMTAIAGTHLDDKQRVSDCLGKITVSGKHLLSLINEVLDLSKIESGRVDLSEAEFSLATFFDELMTIILPTARAKQQTMECKLHDIKHEEVIGDALRLQQVFVNILSNAVKYTPALGKIEVNVWEKPSALNGYAYYQFVFKDNGIGMSEEYLKRIFEPFSRDEKLRGKNIEGTGLGMAIARNIVQMMNGDITVKSKPNEGTEFTVSLFLKVSDSDNAVVKELVDLPVLVADDDQDSCETACHILGEIGMKGEWVLSGREAVDRVDAAHKAKNDYYAVILDWKMPGMDGIETAKQIRAKVGPDVPIIILSAYDWGEVEEQAKAAGVNGFIAKPLFKSRLVYLFRKFAEGKQKKPEGEGSDLKQVQEHNYAGKRILLVEDNDMNREIAVEIIGMTGVEIECAINGKEAVDMFSAKGEGYYDLIFMDIRMPIMNGYEATQAIRKLNRPDAQTIPIVAMSANAFTEDINASKQAGMNEHIVKPMNFKVLTACMDKWLAQK